MEPNLNTYLTKNPCSGNIPPPAGISADFLLHSGQVPGSEVVRRPDTPRNEDGIDPKRDGDIQNTGQRAHDRLVFNENGRWQIVGSLSIRLQDKLTWRSWRTPLGTSAADKLVKALLQPSRLPNYRAPVDSKPIYTVHRPRRTRAADKENRTEGKPLRNRWPKQYY